MLRLFLFFRRDLRRFSPLPTNGLPPKPANSASRGFSSKAASPQAPSSSASLLTATFRGYDIPEEETNAIVAKFPWLLTFNLDKTVRPKLDFLRASGLTGDDLAQILLANPSLLAKSLERSISSSVAFLKSILPSKEALVRVLKSTNNLLTRKHEANVEFLRERGVADPVILRLLHFQPRALARSPEEFAAAVGHVEGDLGLSPASGAYAAALGAMSYMSRSTFLRKVEVYKEEVGWSEGEVLGVFRRMPACMHVSGESLRRKMGFFRERIGWGKELLLVYPVFLTMSLEKRFVPRWAVLNLLASRGLVRKNSRRWPSKFQATNRAFFERYVKKYQEEVPEVVTVYQGKIDFQGWEWLEDSTKKEEEEEKPNNAPKSS